MTKNTIYLNNVYDIYVGLYAFSILFCLNMILRQFLPSLLRSFIMTIAQFAAFFIIALQWVYFFLYQSSITTSGALLIVQTGPAETWEFFGSLGTAKVAAIAAFVVIVLAGLFAINHFQKGLPTTPVYRKLLPLLSLLVIMPSAYALGDAILPDAFPIRTFLDTRDYMQRSALYAQNHTEKFNNLQAIQLNPANYPNTVIVVIGESETRTLMNAYNMSDGIARNGGAETESKQA